MKMQEGLSETQKPALPAFVFQKKEALILDCFGRTTFADLEPRNILWLRHLHETQIPLVINEVDPCFRYLCIETHRGSITEDHVRLSERFEQVKMTNVQIDTSEELGFLLGMKSLTSLVYLDYWESWENFCNICKFVQLSRSLESVVIPDDYYMRPLECEMLGNAICKSPSILRVRFSYTSDLRNAETWRKALLQNYRLQEISGVNDDILQSYVQRNCEMRDNVLRAIVCVLCIGKVHFLRRDILGLVARALWATRYEECWTTGFARGRYPKRRRLRSHSAQSAE